MGSSDIVESRRESQESKGDPEELEKILIKRAEDTTAMEAAFWAVSNDILFK